ncbi:phospholipid-translocating P-type ATPase [Terfezia boudieri ATCC MYA-4762]|uniref:Phospholipid-transporting ATPase n=1 Tax=Terfezia boudieri ATCC MYA-4762 TaxID=1051890 RepID=A0A3N4LX96_9PEZI|nr:phospholipid-translocating P-type ATPase [Terfezia boudieri ATCC MYA-4762]
MRAFSNRRNAVEKEGEGQAGGSGSDRSDDSEATEVDDDSSHRRIFVNQPLPPDALDEDGSPSQSFSRNKIRTAKYTPLMFIPKNLWLQFHNVANVYFLFVTILAIFPIFGATNPALGSVPLIFILLVTAVKDAIEDYRRTVLDNELNNTAVHLLVNWENGNVTDDHISTWRRIKKATSRGLRYLVKQYKKQTVKRGKGKAKHDLGNDLERTQTRASVYTVSSASESIQMTPVGSPVSSKRFSFVDGMPTDVSDRRQHLAVPDNSVYVKSKPASKFRGSVIDPHRPTPGVARFKSDYWKNVRVGDFVRIYNDEEIPADIIILSTSDADGACYVETKNLDGETNLKVRHALFCGREVRHAKDCEAAVFTVNSEPPHANLYRYSGVVKWNQKDPKAPEKEGAPMEEPVSINNLLLRGCTLRNTDWIIGVVAFTGDETKIMMNAGITPSKRSRITRELNWNVIINFVLLLIMCLASGIVSGLTWAKGHESLDYFEFGSIGGSAPIGGIVTFWTAVILFQNLVPISLYISIEIVKLAQAFFIYSDVDMYYAHIDYPCTPKSWNISDDLGQIEYIFSDKTGTLTQNVMEFKKCTINGIAYGEAYTEAQAGMDKRAGVDVEVEGAKARAQIAKDRVSMLRELREIHKNPYLDDDKLTFVSSEFVADLRGAAGEEQAKANSHFMLALALCHTVLPDRLSDDPPRIDFKAQSPDEAALVATARDCGFTLLERTSKGVRLSIQGTEVEFEVLNTLEFNSSRKRMSAIIRMPDGKIILFCKGADSVIYSRLAPGQQAGLRSSTAEHLEIFAREGLRTLCIAQKELTEEEYRVWNREHEIAAAAVHGREEKLEEVADAMERELTLLGGTAIEDRLQDGVPDTIALLAEAGIKLWVLTGDKVETAINIGFSCNLLDNGMDLILVKVDDDSIETAAKMLNEYLQVFNLHGTPEELEDARKDHNPPAPTHALVIDGEALKLFLDEGLRMKFLLLCKQCKAVLCCRVSPSQKASVVEMVKKGLDVMTLSIGDGANDVAMIQEADVGVGIAGVEGRAAVMSSDYAIGQFRFLGRLVLVHGRWSYHRLAEMVANFFYKNIVWTVALFWYQLYNSFDGSYLFEYTYILLYNLLFTSVPIILMGILDQDVSDKVSLAVPQLYRRGILRQEWTQTKFWVYMIDGIYQSVMCFFLTYFLFADADAVTRDGLDLAGREQMGVYVASSAIVVVNLYILMNTYRWDWLFGLIVAISILCIWIWTFIFSSFKSTNAFHTTSIHVYGALSFWAVVFLTITICLLPRLAAKTIQKLFFPLDVDIIREQVRSGKFDYLEQPGTASTVPPSTTASLEEAKPAPIQQQYIEEDERPIYPPSVAPTSTTVGKRGSGNGSDGTDGSGYQGAGTFTPHRFSMDRGRTSFDIKRPSMDRPRHSIDRVRMSMDRARPSFEATNDFTTAAMLARIECTQSHTYPKRVSQMSQVHSHE